MTEELNLNELRALLGDSEPAAAPSSVSSDPVEGQAVSPVAFVSVPQRTGERSTRKVSRKKKKRALRKSVPFFAVFAVITLCAWMIPLRPTVSVRENRNLDRFPSFSFSSLLSGDYFSGIDNWFSDTFTFRETWMDLGDWLEGFYGRSSAVLSGSPAQHSDEIPVTTPSAAPEEFSAAAMSEQPEVSSEEPAAEENSAAEDEPHSVARELSEIDLENEYVAKSTCIVMDGSVYPYVNFTQFYADKYTDSLNKAADLLEGKARVFDLLALRSTSVMLSKSVREYMNIPLEEDILDYMFGRMQGKVNCVDSLYTLQNHNAEYLYFHSDHHWTAVGAYYAYVSWCKTAGVDPVPLDLYEEEVFGPYTGTYYGHNSKRSPVLEDEVHTFNPPGDITLYINDGRDSPTYLGFENEVITHTVTQDYYASFLASDHAMCTFVNNDIPNESAVLIIKDSYGNPFSYYFTQHYKYVYAIDYRRYFNRSLTDFVDTYHVDDVIFCTAMFLAQSDGGTQLLSNFIR